MLVQLDTYLCGTRIRVARGQLAGLTGDVAEMADDNGNYLLTIDGWASGVYLVVSGDNLALEIDEYTAVSVRGGGRIELGA